MAGSRTVRNSQLAAAALGLAAVGGALLLSIPPLSRPASANDDANAGYCKTSSASFASMVPNLEAADANERAALASMNTARDHWAKLHMSYVEARDAARDEAGRKRAHEMWAELDRAWTARKDSVATLIDYRRTNISVTQPACALISAANSAGCLADSTFAPSCEAALSEMQTGLSRNERLLSEVSQSWRTSAEERLGDSIQCDTYFRQAPVQTIHREVSGSVTAVSGRAFIVRGIRTAPIRTGDAVKPGDVVAVEEGGAVSIDLFGTGILKISEKTKFEVPDPRNAPPPPGIAAQAWSDLNEYYQRKLIDVGLSAPCACPNGWEFEAGGCVRILSGGGVRG